MKAAVLSAFGPPDVLHLREVTAPVVKGHDVLIRVRATSVNFGDLLVRNFAAVSPHAFHMPWLFWLIGKLLIINAHTTASARSDFTRSRFEVLQTPVTCAPRRWAS